MHPSCTNKVFYSKDDETLVSILDRSIPYEYNPYIHEDVFTPSHIFDVSDDVWLVSREDLDRRMERYMSAE